MDHRHEGVLLAAALAPGLAAALAPGGAGGDRLVLAFAAVSGAAVLGLLARSLRQGGPRTRHVLLAAAVLRLLPVLGPARFDDDVWRYLWDGAATASGVSPYRFAPQQVLDFDPRFDPLLLGPEDLTALRRLVRQAAVPRMRRVLEQINFPQFPTIYPPVSQMAFALAAAAAPGSDRVWRLLAALADLAAAGLLVLVLRRLGRPEGWAAAYALHPLPALEAAAGGHQDPLGVALVLAATLAVLHGRRARAGAALAAAAGVKLFPAVLALAWLRELRWRGLLAACAAAALLAVPFLALGLPKLDGLGVYLRRWEFFSGPYALLGLLPGNGRIWLALVLAGLAAASRPWQARAPAQSVGLGLLWIEGLVLLSPVVNPWYVPWALAAGAVRGSAAWPVFALLAPLAYGPYTAEGHPWPLRLAAWGPLEILMLAREALEIRRQQARLDLRAADGSTR